MTNKELIKNIFSDIISEIFEQHEHVEIYRHEIDETIEMPILDSLKFEQSMLQLKDKYLEKL